MNRVIIGEEKNRPYTPYPHNICLGVIIFVLMRTQRKGVIDFRICIAVGVHEKVRNTGKFTKRNRTYDKEQRVLSGKPDFDLIPLIELPVYQNMSSSE